MNQSEVERPSLISLFKVVILTVPVWACFRLLIPIFAVTFPDAMGSQLSYSWAYDKFELIMCSVGADFWALFLMSAIVPERVGEWFRRAQRNIVREGESAHVRVADWEVQQEFSSDELASAWAFCLAKELGELELAACLQRYLQPRVLKGFELDPYVSGLCLLGDRLEPGAFRRGIYNGIVDR